MVATPWDANMDAGQRDTEKGGGRVGVGSVNGGSATAAGSASTVRLHSLAMLLAWRDEDRGRGGGEGGGGGEKKKY